MKKKKSLSEFGRERNLFLLRSFRESIAAQSKISAANAFKMAVKTAVGLPAPRFWVSEARAAAVIGRMLAGVDLAEGMYPEKKEMFRELFARFLVLREKFPDKSISELCAGVINEEAPRSYISWHRARVLIFDELARVRKEKLEAKKRRSDADEGV